MKRRADWTFLTQVVSAPGLPTWSPKSPMYRAENIDDIPHRITLTLYIVLPLFATRFAAYTGGIRVSHTATSLLIWYKMFCMRDISYRLLSMKFINMLYVCAVFQITASPPARSRQLWRRTRNFFKDFLQFYVYDLRFKAGGLTTFFTEFWTLVCAQSGTHRRFDWWIIAVLT